MATAAIGAAGSILGGIVSGKGAQKAAQIQAQAQANALAEQQREYNTNQQNFAPYLAAGTNALGGATTLLGLNGNGAQQAAISGIQASPYFTSQDQAGQDALLQAAAATGGLRGGNAQSALYSQRASLLASAIQNQLSGLTGLSSLGAGAAGTAGGLGNQTSSNISNIYQQQGNVGASGALAGAANTNLILNGLTQSLGTFASGNVNRNSYNADVNSLTNYANNIGAGAGYGITPNLSW